MSIKANIDSLPLKTREKLVKELTIKEKNNQYTSIFSQPKTISCYNVIEDDVYLPMSYAIENLKLERPSRESFKSMNKNAKFNLELRDEQNEVKKEILTLLNRGYCLLSLRVGFGKTFLSIYLSTMKIKLKTLVLVHRIILINQWKNEIETSCGNSVKIQILNTKSEYDSEADFYIINAANVAKLADKHGVNFFKDIGTIIVDEVHTIATKQLSSSLYYLTPRYCIALSATPSRPDGMDSLINLYFGKESVTRKLFRKHKVYKIESGIELEFKINSGSGKIDWNSLIESQASSLERNEFIIKLIICFSELNFLVLCKRIDQINYLFERLKEENITVTHLSGTKNEYDLDSRVLLATCQKVGFGFSHKKLNGLIVAADIEEYFIQYLGRVFRTEDSEPIIFDIVDKHPILISHFNTRRRIYKQCGGELLNFHEHYELS